MGYNHAQAKKRFLAEWRIKFRYYRQNGLTLEQILPLYKMYNAELRSDRSYYEQTEPLTDRKCEEAKHYCPLPDCCPEKRNEEDEVKQQKTEIADDCDNYME